MNTILYFSPRGAVYETRAYSKADIDARAAVTGWMRDASLEVATDRAGNLVGRRAGRDTGARPIVFGSHIDSVPEGGNYDGDVGSMSAIGYAIRDDVNAVLAPLVIVFSGQLVPLNFFPQSVQPLLHLQPFAGLVDIPFRIYFANLAGSVALQSLALQAGWTLALIALGRIAMERVMRRLEMQGG